MKQVSKEQFFDAIGKLNVHPQIQTGWPYTCDWKLNAGIGPIVGRTVEQQVPGTDRIEKTYFLP